MDNQQWNDQASDSRSTLSDQSFNSRACSFEDKFTAKEPHVFISQMLKPLDDKFHFFIISVTIKSFFWFPYFWGSDNFITNFSTTDFKASDLDFFTGTSPFSSISWFWRLLIILSRLNVFKSLDFWIDVTLGMYQTGRLLRIFLTWSKVVQLLFKTWSLDTRIWNLENMVSISSSSYIMNSSYCWTKRLALASWTC